MIPRSAMVLVADEIYYNLHGKATLQGIYNTDLFISANPTQTPQLIFFFLIETDIKEPFKKLEVTVALPGSDPVTNFVMVPPPEYVSSQAQAGRTHWYIRHPMLISSPILRPGRIEAKVIHEDGELIVPAHWIVMNTQQPRSTN